MITQTGDRVEELIARRRPGFSLEQAFYCDPDVFAADMERVVFRQWLFVDHESRIPEAGDYFLHEIAGESIIVVRGGDGAVRAFYNVCRHRGSRVCTEGEGNVRLFVCPYHAWAYDLDGSLKAARMMEEGFDAGNWGLHPVHVGVCEGLIFINLSKGEPEDFEAFMEPLVPHLKLHGIAEARLAHRASYPTAGNWKLVVENFFECYHCQPAHPEYSRVHAADFILAYGGGRGSGPDGAEEAFEPKRRAFEERARALGQFPEPFGDDGNGLHMRGAERLPLSHDFLSETKDGRPVGPLMGDFKERDGGYTGVSWNPFGTFLMSNDFATLFRFVPRDPLNTDVELFWFVSPDAVPGDNLDVERMIWLWDVTTIADKRIIEDNQAGVLSRAYEPGPYAAHERGTEWLIQWYLRWLSDSGEDTTLRAIA